MGNTTSERVSGERHGSKSHRSDGSGAAHPAKEHPHKIMVGSTDDPSVFSSHDSKIPGDKEFVSWQPDLEESVKPSQQARPTVIRWADGGKEVFISGSFNNWSTKIPLIKSHNDFVAILDLPEGEHQYKFFVDGQWVHDPSEPVVTSQMGTINNLIHVKKSDFEVFDALKVDSLESSETSGRAPSQSRAAACAWLREPFRTGEYQEHQPFLSGQLFVQLPTGTLWPRDVCIPARGALQIPTHPSTSPPPGHPQQGHQYLV
ncbi:5'-AMP-activated protein kinase subunit beta-2 isoform X3 [Oenanthe melanoleuca]|uniref:5'-AMP-activated protein kinase subunit beta-2 isoform X3 n=1 Tax=Oenanthe melanoleuca TaxID=2939378 RepID=UPI0024C1C50B|nr:5'-AMP-activated protein kinase subunit beta-2 isoform X3 [Oenanthe melanoleuca]